ncbi:MAG TPA: 50S ribosomal protein L18 [Candidatus Omnitrophota bacterium]|nr:50S ribosomal protein L18 [Candidatus Omnitrophota bacterium]HPD83950.1 50S ribosomal protein L18 [Candidatus Omnitrophota bacterium]HRZ02807.1 50S ribosomal protein L18 [Candidatus Omnitrophota bacterium]
MKKITEVKRVARHERLRKKIIGTLDQPRLCVHRSIKNLHAQIIDDVAQKVLFGISTLDKQVRAKIKSGGNVGAATVLGEALAVKAKEKGIKKVCFDRGGYLYHGRVKAFAEAARKGGLEF